jgi:CopG family nickel-responsive transcriptional regulator
MVAKKKDPIARIGVSLEGDLLDRFDALIAERGYASRSDALRDLIRGSLIESRGRKGGGVAGAITLVYDHHRRDLAGRLTEIQHGFQHLIISTQHIHLDHDHCLEIVAVRGKGNEIERLASALRSVKGVGHGTVSMSSAAGGEE